MELTANDIAFLRRLFEGCELKIGSDEHSPFEGIGLSEAQIEEDEMKFWDFKKRQGVA